MTANHRISAIWIATAIVVACGTAQAQTPIRIEAEDMQLDTYRIETLNFASNGAVINLKGSGFAGNASADFTGASGQYDVSVVYHDENDGLAQLSVSIGGETVDVWTLDLKSSEAQPKEANRQTRQVAQGFAVDNGDEIVINGLQGNWDNANVDYIEFVSAGQNGPGNPPVVLDFSDGDISIDEPGYYVLDRSWDVSASLAVQADDVTIDLRGYMLNITRLSAAPTTERSILKNGSIENSEVYIASSNCLVTDVRIEKGELAVTAGCQIQNSTLSDSFGGCTGCTVKSNHISQTVEQYIYFDSAKVLDNDIQSDCDHELHFMDQWCIDLGDANVFARNTIRRTTSRGVDNIFWLSSNNLFLDNLILGENSERLRAGPISVYGTGNLLRGNIIRSTTSGVPWCCGITFNSDGNFYGDNLVWAEVPFYLEGTAQIDLGGNQGIEPD